MQRISGVLKWENTYKYRKCGHDKSQIHKDFSKTCNICRDTESSTSGILFHKVKFGLRKAFFICFEMSTTTKSLSASQMSVRYGIAEQTARLFMQKVRETIKSSENHPLTGIVHVDEFVVGGKERGKPERSYDAKKKKVVCAVELTEEGMVKRFYALKIKDFSGKSLIKIFDIHIDEKATITTDEWKGYIPLSKEYILEQIPSNDGENFKALYKKIHQVKSWIRMISTWVLEFNIDRYLAEFSFRINPSQSKNTIFNNFIKRIVVSDNIYQEKLICS